jgi:hypothetical protein
MIFSLFLVAEAPPRFAHIKWDREALVTTGRAGNNRQFGTADPERASEQPYNGIVRRSIARRFRDAYFELLASVRCCPPAADARLRRSGD